MVVHVEPRVALGPHGFDDRLRQELPPLHLFERNVVAIRRLRDVRIRAEKLNNLVGLARLPNKLGTKSTRNAKRSLLSSSAVRSLSKRAMYDLTLAGSSNSEGDESCSRESG